MLVPITCISLSDLQKKNPGIVVTEAQIKLANFKAMEKARLRSHEQPKTIGSEQGADGRTRSPGNESAGLRNNVCLSIKLLRNQENNIGSDFLVKALNGKIWFIVLLKSLKLVFVAAENVSQFQMNVRWHLWSTCRIYFNLKHNNDEYKTRIPLEGMTRLNWK